MSQEESPPARRTLEVEPSGGAQVALRKSATFFRRNPAAAISLGFLLVLVLVTTVLAPVLATHDPRKLAMPDRLEGPSPRHFFGTDQVGRDLYSRSVYGGRFSLLVGFSVALLAAGAAIIVGLISGWFPLADKVIMRVVDGMLAIPTLLLAIAVMVIFGPTVINVIGVLALGAVPSGSRVARAAVLSQKNQAFVEAARALGAPTSADHVAPRSPKHDCSDGGGSHCECRRRNSGRGQPRLPGSRHRSGFPYVGQHDGRSAGLYVPPFLDDVLARNGDHAGGPSLRRGR